MQVSQPQTIRDIITAATTKYLSQAEQWVSVEIIKQRTTKLIDCLSDAAGVECQVGKGQPQLEAEDAKVESDFEKTVSKEVRKSLDALRNL
jgi:hypothetical protein